MLRGLLLLLLLLKEEFHIDAVCTFNSKTYTEGEVWYPLADRIGAGCVNCTCTNDKVNCKSVSCPLTKCQTPTFKAGLCCPVCEDIGNIIPTVDLPNNGGDGAAAAGCDYHGKKYADKQIFASNDTALKRTTENQCVNCVCQSPSVFCYLKTCIIPKKCKTIKRVQDDCCPQCMDPQFRSAGFRRESDCIYKEEIKSNGSSWNALDPVTGEKSPCITCVCLNGQTNCEKEVCPVLKCKRKRRRKGQCCPFCRKRRKNRRRKNKKKRKGKRRNRKDRKRGKKNRKRKNKDSCNRKRRRNKVTRRNRRSKCINSTMTTSLTKDNKCNQLYQELGLSTNGVMPCHFNNLCLPGATDFIVYRNLTKSGHLLIAFDDVTKGTVEAWSFLANSTGVFRSWNTYEKCSSDVFRKHMTAPKMILGSARGKMIKKFKRQLGANSGGNAAKERGLKKCISSGTRDCKRLLMRQLVCADFEDLKKLGTCS